MGGAERVVMSGLSSGLSVFFEYDTPKIVHISSKKVGVINRLIQLVILAYLIGSVTLRFYSLADPASVRCLAVMF